MMPTQRPSHRQPSAALRAIEEDGGVCRSFRNQLASIAANHRPSSFPVFSRLAALPYATALDPEFLGRFHLVYQAGMHATRAMVYFLPHLDSPALRKRKLQIFVDDDGLADGGTHHYQLTRVFRNLGARILVEDEWFGELDDLCLYLDSRMAHFVRKVVTLYPRSLGPWCIVATLADDAMRSLAIALSVHAPTVVDEPCFADCFDHDAAERRAGEAIAITETVLAARPALLDRTLADAEAMAGALDGVWLVLGELVQAMEARAA